MTTEPELVRRNSGVHPVAEDLQLNVWIFSLQRHEPLESKTEEEPEAPAEEEAPVETEMEVAITEASEEPEVTAVEEPAAPAEATAEAAEVEAAAEVLEPQPVTEIASGGEVAEEEEAEMEVLAPEEASEASAETPELITKTEVPLVRPRPTEGPHGTERLMLFCVLQDAPAQLMEIQVVSIQPLKAM